MGVDEVDGWRYLGNSGRAYILHRFGDSASPVPEVHCFVSYVPGNISRVAQQWP